MKKHIFKTTIENNFINEFSITLLRIIPALMMAFLHGMGKTPPSEKFLAGVEGLGFPMPAFFAWAAALTEFVGGLFLAIGLLTRPAALLMTITMVVAAFGRHLNDPMDVKEMSLLYLVIALTFACRGAGRWSVDNFLSKK